MNKKPVAIVGAGISGLSLARILADKNMTSFIIEKSKALGGRLATRRDGESTYDHGAAFYENSSEQSMLWHRRWVESHKSKLWFSENNSQYICGTQGMTALAKDLAEGLQIFNNEKVLSFGILKNGVNIFCESGKILHAESLVLTSPLPQSIEILENSNIVYPEALKKIQYSKAVVGLFELASDASAFEFNYIKPQGAIFSISNNQAKGISKNLALSVLMSQEWSELHFDLQEDRLIELVKAELAVLFKQKPEIAKAQIKKWRYSQPQSAYSQKFEVLSNARVFLAGDAFGGPSVSGAISSAQAVSEEIFKNKYQEVFNGYRAWIE